MSSLPAVCRFLPSRRLIATGAAGVVFLIALWAGQIIIRITNRDGQVTEIRPAPGAKVEIIDTEKAALAQSSQRDQVGDPAGKPDLPTAALADKEKPFIVIRAGGQREAFKRFESSSWVKPR